MPVVYVRVYDGEDVRMSAGVNPEGCFLSDCLKLNVFVVGYLDFA
jgi:hypothetical protein